MKRVSSTVPPDSVDERLKACLGLLDLAEAGKLDELPCPQCKESAVSVWIARPAPDEYRTWFTCQKCGFHTRMHNTGRPSYYTQDRDLSRKEAATT